MAETKLASGQERHAPTAGDTNGATRKSDMLRGAPSSSERESNAHSIWDIAPDEVMAVVLAELRF